jgi:uncharacterized membrane protein SpoIIM required for sporulation
MERMRLRSSDFRRERLNQWLELERLISRADKKGLRSLSADELHRLPGLYRAGVSSLSVARAISLDRGLLQYLESLVTRAYFCLYGVKPRVGSVIASFFTRIWPRTVRRLSAGVLIALFVMLSGAALGWALRDPDVYNSVVPEHLASGRSPASSNQELRSVLYSGGEQSGEELGLFATFLFTHNAKVGLFSFALGFALGLPSLLLLFYNGLVLGCMAGLYASRGMSLEFWAWVLPHGVTELLAVGLCGGAGLALALAVLRPGRHGRRHAVSRTGRLAALLVLGAVLMFLLAGVLEGIFRQVIQDVPSRYATAVVTFLFWLLYFLRTGRTEKET